MTIIKTNHSGFTLIEILIVIAIIGVLAAVMAPSYRLYVRRSIAAEGEGLVESIANAEKLYYIDNNAFYATGDTDNSPPLSINSAANQYFRRYTITTTATSYRVTTNGAAGTDAAGISVTSDGTNTTASVIAVNGL